MNDRDTFRNLAFGSCALGVLATVTFHASVWTSDFKEQKTKKQQKVSTWRNWFRTRQFYAITVLYCFVRLVVNMIAAYLPFYLQETLQLEKKFISIVPLIQFISGLFVSFGMEFMSNLIGKVATLLLGCGSLIIANLTIQYGGDLSKAELYVTAVTFGAGISTILIQTLVRNYFDQRLPKHVKGTHC